MKIVIILFSWHTSANVAVQLGDKCMSQPVIYVRHKATILNYYDSINRSAFGILLWWNMALRDICESRMNRK